MIMKLNNDQKLLMDAVESGDIGTVKKLVRKGINPDFCFEASLKGSPLYLAALNDDYEMVKFLVEEGKVKIDAELATLISIGMDRVNIGNYISRKVIEMNSKKF